MNMKNIFCYLLILLFLFSCSAEGPNTKEEYELKMQSLHQEIENLISTGSCNEASDCDYLPLGEKACGGPHAYVVFSADIDVEKLKQLVNEYTLLEKEYNDKFGIPSDCSLVNPPENIGCVNSKCAPQ